MGLIEELGTQLASASSRFTLGTNTFLNDLPDKPNTATSLVEYGGGPPDFVFAGSLPVNENQRVQIACRSSAANPTIARANAAAAWAAVSGIANQSLSSHSWLRAKPVQSPFLLRRDEQNRAIFAFNVDIMRRTTST